jgi:hypothetical protein
MRCTRRELTPSAAAAPNNRARAASPRSGLRAPRMIRAPRRQGLGSQFQTGRRTTDKHGLAQHLAWRLRRGHGLRPHRVALRNPKARLCEFSRRERRTGGWKPCSSGARPMRARRWHHHDPRHEGSLR